MRILVVDHEPSARLHLRLLLEQWGPVEEANSAELALAHARAAARAGDPYDLICVDLPLPGSVGSDALASLRAEQQAALVELVGVANGAGAPAVATPGTDAGVVKPVTAAQLRQVVERHQRGPRQG